MTDERDLDGLDPYALMAREAQRIDDYARGLGEADLSRPSRCAGWSVRDLLAHLAASEQYNRACLDGKVPEFMAQIGEMGATDLASANEVGIRSYDGRDTASLLDEWRRAIDRNRADLLARDGGDIDTSVGPYPARWQAVHLAFELAVHADDIAAPVSDDERAARVEWEARASRFMLREAKPDAEISGGEGRTHVRTGDVDAELDDADFVSVASARVPPGSDIDPKIASALSVTP